MTKEQKETYQKWRDNVNMSKSELQRFYDSDEGKKAGLSKSEADKQGIDYGRESARWIFKMKDTPVADWTDNMWRWAKKQNSFISRMSGVKGRLYNEKGEKTRKHLSLLIWGHNPEKKGKGGKLTKEAEKLQKQSEAVTQFEPEGFEVAFMKRGGRTIAQTPAPKKERIFGSKINKIGSAKSKSSGKDIKFSDEVIEKLKNKVSEYNSKHKNKVNLATLKAVYRRGLGAYSTSHRPTISGGKPNSRNAWAIARVNKFLEKKAGKPVKKAYVQDDDLLENGGMTYSEYAKTQFNEEEDRYLPSGYLREFEILENTKGRYPILYLIKNGYEYRLKSEKDSSIGVFDSDKQIGYADNKIIQVSPIYQKKGIGLQLVTILKERNPNHRFGSMTPEGFNLMGKYYDVKIASNKYAKGGLLAPNGKPSNLSPKQYRLVRTPEFKAWFGDWENDPENASKVVDENGEPLLVYHSSNINFDIFKKERGKFFGIYFSENKNSTKTYGNITREFFLNIRNPKKPKIWVYSVIDYSMYQQITNSGFDGAFWLRKKYNSSEYEFYEIVVFNPNQIKLADGTNTTFDPENPDIRYKEGGVTSNENWVSVFEIGEDEEEFRDGWTGKTIPKKSFYAWLYNDIKAEEKLKSGKYDLAKFKSQLGDFWNVDVESYKGAENLIAVLKGRISDNGKEIYILTMTTKPSYRRKGAMSYLIKSVRDKLNLDRENVHFFGLTDMGKKFYRKKRFQGGGNLSEYLLAPNGKPSNLSPEQYRLVRTPEFKAWFGDWENDPEKASKVVDENGEPLLVYVGRYGKPQDYGFIFKRGYDFMNKGFGNNFGFFFTKNIKVAKYLSGEGHLLKDEGFIHNVFLKIENILDLTFLKDSSTPKQFQDYLHSKGIYFEFVKPNKQIIYQEYYEDDYNPIWYYFDYFPELYNYINKKYDGLVFIDDTVNYYDKTYVVFKSEQIKLADGSNTTFDPVNPDIRYDDGGEIENLIKQGVIELNFYPATPQHAEERGIIAKKPLYIQNLCVSESMRLKGIGKKVLTYLEDYALKNGYDLIFGYCDVGMVKNWLYRKGYAINDLTNEFHKQIKLADGSNTTFDPENPDIRYDEGGGVSDFSKVSSASSRFRPVETIVFDPPLVGTNGAKLVSYTWRYEWTMQPNKEGEAVGKRVSDWTQAENSAETGRDIVHVYNIEMPDGSIKSVSSESVPILLGFIDREQKKVFGSLATASKTLAKNQMKLAIMEAQEKEYQDLYKKFESDKKPPIEIASPGEYPLIAKRIYDREMSEKGFVDFIFYKIGNIQLRENYDIRSKEQYENYLKKQPSGDIVRMLENEWIVEKVKEAGAIRPNGIYDLRNRVERQKRKVEQMLKSEKSNEMYDDGGNINNEVTILSDIKNVSGTDWRFVRISGNKYDKIELYRKYEGDGQYYGYLLYRKVPKYKLKFKSKMVNDRNQLSAFAGGDIVGAVISGKKPFGSLVLTFDNEEGKNKAKIYFNEVIKKCKQNNLDYYLSEEENRFDDDDTAKRQVLQICHKGTFSELFDLDAFYEDYVNAKVVPDYAMSEVVDRIKNRKLSYYLKGFEWDEEFKPITGLILGIPLYFTMSIVNSGQTYAFRKKYDYDETNYEEGGVMKIDKNDLQIALPDVYSSPDNLQRVLNQQGYDLVKKETKSQEMEQSISISQVADIHGVSVENLRNELVEGIKTEMEHTSDPEEAKKIALDHLKENPHYYQYLQKMEAKMKADTIDGHFRDLEMKYNNGGTIEPVYKLKTPTGEPSRLNYIQQVLVRTTQFKNWFGDWETASRKFLADNRSNFEKHFEGVSKVLDMITLEPQAVYHGTRVNEEFFEFDVSMEEGIGRPYGYFADNPEYSENFITGSSNRGQHSGTGFLYSCFLNMKKPFYAINDQFYGVRQSIWYFLRNISSQIMLDRYGYTVNMNPFDIENETPEKKAIYLDIAIEITDQITKYGKEVAWGGTGDAELPFWTLMSRDKESIFKRFLMREKYDGIRYAEEFSSNYDIDNPAEFTKAWCIFNSGQVKLADGRNIDFDPLKVDIRMAAGGKTTAPEEAENKQMPLSRTQIMKMNMGLEETQQFGDGGSVYGDKKHSTDAKDGGYFVGNSHAKGGIKAINKDTGQIIEVEGNEVIINKRSVADQTKREFEGEMLTNREILSKINEMGGGVKFEAGGKTSEHCGCSGKKYKFGGETLEDYIILYRMNKLSESILSPREQAVKELDGLINKIYGI